MNLLIEQRPSPIPSSNAPSQSSEQSNDNDIKNSSSSASSSASLVLKIKRHNAKQQTNDTISKTSPMAEDEDDEDNNHQSSTRSTVQNSRLKRPNSNTSTRRPSSPAFNGKQQQQQQQQQGTKRSVTIDNNNNDLPSHLEEISARKRFKPDDCNSSSNKIDACVETVSVGLATEPDHLGPCEPGTSVVLEGIVWNETDSGVLVVNVTWRGKTYVGTLLDSTKQDWACPRLTCDSPTSDYDVRQTSKNSRSKRHTAGANTRSSNQHQSVSSFQQITSIIMSSGIDDRRLRNNIKSRQSKRINQLSMANVDEVTNNGSPLTSPHLANQTFFTSETSTSANGKTAATSNGEPQLILCPELNCHKRFASNVALGYHLSNAHPKSSTITPTPISQASTRDEEDVAHILANVAHYARRVSPSSSIRSSPDHSSNAISSPNLHHSPSSSRNQIQTSTLVWPCPQISSNLVQSAALNNDERTMSPNSIRSPSTVNPLLESTFTIEQTDLPLSVNIAAPHSIGHSQEDLQATPSISILKSHCSPLNSTNIEQNDTQQLGLSPTPTSSTFVPIDLASSIPPTSSSPAYSDISDEDPTTTPHEQMIPRSTINLLASTNGKLDDNGNKIVSAGFLPSNGGLVSHPDLSNPAWAAQMLLQQFGSYMSQSTLIPTTTSIVASTGKEIDRNPRSNTPNGLNSKISGPTINGNNDSTVKNILEARRSSTMKTSPTSSSPPMNLYHYHSNGTSIDNKFSAPIINTLTSPNENLLHPSNLTSTTSTATTTTMSTLKPMDILDYSLNPSHSATSNGQYPHSSSLHPSR